MASFLDSFSTPGASNSGGSNDWIKLLMQQQQSPGQSLSQLLPYLPYIQNMNNYTKPSAELATGMADLNSPRYLGLYNQFKQQGQENLSHSINEAEQQNRKAAALGRTPLFSPDRAGEQSFRALTSGYQDVQNNASKQALGQLNNAYNAQSQQDMMKKQNALTKANVFGNATGAIAKLFGL